MSLYFSLALLLISLLSSGVGVLFLLNPLQTFAFTPLLNRKTYDNNKHIMERSSSPSEDSNEDISAVANYQEQKKKSILEFCKKDDRSFSPFPRPWDRDPPPTYGMLSSIPPDIWEGGKRDFAQGLYEQAEKASDQNIVPIIERDVLKIMWRVGEF